MTKGSIELDGERIDRLAPFEVVRRGVVQVFEGRRVFEHLTVEENLIAGAHPAAGGGAPRGSSGSTNTSRGWGSAAASRRATCRAASSRCS